MWMVLGSLDKTMKPISWILIDNPKLNPDCGVDDGLAIEWDGGEEFYNYVEWLKYIVKNFLAPKSYVLNGRVRYEGESDGDIEYIVVEDNKIQ